MKRRRLITIQMVAFAALVSSTDTARADDEAMLNERVSASACQPRSSADRSKLVWEGTVWIFKAGESGSVVLECPIFTPFEDEDIGPREISELRMWYQDSDGRTLNGEVSVSLRRVSGTSGSLSSVLVGSSLSSNTSSNMSVGVHSVSFPPVSMFDAQYFAVVTMSRNDTIPTVRFRGLSFFTKP